MADITQFAQEYTEKKEAEEAARPKSVFTHDQLVDALYWAWDAFDRAGILFFVIFETGKQVKKLQDLSGDHIDIGVRKLEWISGAKPVLDAFMEHNRVPSEQEENIITYFYDGVPVKVHVLDPDDDCLFNADTVVYMREFFRVPNPYERFEQLYG